MLQLIQKTLQENGYNFTISQIEQKFRSLERKYKKIKIHNNKTGNNKMICAYEQELDEIFAQKPNVFPEYVLDENAGTSTLNRSAEIVNETSSSSNLDVPVPKKTNKFVQIETNQDTLEFRETIIKYLEKSDSRKEKLFQEKLKQAEEKRIIDEEKKYYREKKLEMLQTLINMNKK